MNLLGERGSRLTQFVAVTIALSLSFVLLSATPSHATPPTLPPGDELHAYGYFAVNTQEVTLNTVDAVGTLVNPAVAPSAMEYTEGAGYDSVTELTWFVTDYGLCRIWSLAADGTATNRWDVRTIAGLPNIDKCWALMTNNDGTAWVSAEDTALSAHYLMKVNLSTGVLIGSVLSPSQSISGMSIDPTTGQLWASTPPAGGSTAPGLYHLDTLTASLSNRIDTSSLGVDVWDIAFDSSGRLWMSVWGADAELASLVPTAANPLTTYQNSGIMMLSGSFLDSDALWFRNSTPAPPAPPVGLTLANTGSDFFAPVTIALLFTVMGAASLYYRRHRRA